MLEFLVLGYIPGTNIRIGFTSVLAIGIGLVVAYELLRLVVRHSRKLANSQLTIDDLAL